MTRVLQHSTLFLLLSWLLIPAQKTAAQIPDPPHEPILRLETGMHTAIIPHMAADASGHFLVTASHDKTARVWELPSGRLLRVLRPPVGDGNEGKLYSVAISPDGSTVAVGGWTLPESLGSVIYLFDRESGKVLRRLTGLPEVTYQLVYSRDGRYLAAGLDSTGIRVYQTASYTLAGEDRDYGGACYGADFDGANRLATTSLDGFIRLYELKSAAAGGAEFRLITKRQAVGGRQPFDIKFSPEGARLALGFNDSIRPSVLSAHDLSVLYTPDTSGIPDTPFTNLAILAWSAAGNMLFATGRTLAANDLNFIRVWRDGGRGGYRDLSLDSTSTIFCLVALPGGGLVYTTGDPALSLLDANGKSPFLIRTSTADFRGGLRNFRLSPDGSEVQFSYALLGQAPARFSTATHGLEVSAQSAAGARPLQPAITEASGLTVTDWFNTLTPKLNGQPLPLRANEMARSLAIAPDASAFLLGTEQSLRLFNRSGTLRWQAAAPDPAWAVNISADGKLAVAAYGDGTIRWYRMSDGKELLVFFPHADQKRWVLWTPSGYYDAAPGAEGLIGWHINNGRDAAADFFPVGQFRSVYYRPDVVSKVLQTGDEQLALKEANEEAGRKQQQASVAQLLPPVVEIVSPQDGAELPGTEVVVRFNVRTPSGEPVTEVRALVDGRPATAERGVSVQAAGARELRVSVPAGESQISIIAANRYTTSVPATVRVRAPQPVIANAPTGSAARPTTGTTAGGAGVSPTQPRPAAAAGEQFEIRPKLYVLAIGVSAYANPDFKLGFAAKDAQDFAAAWTRQKDALYRDVVVKVLTDDKATKDEVLDGLDWIRKETTAKDVAVVLFAGHGVNDQNGQYYFLPFNADPDRLLRTGVSFADIRNTVAAVAGKTLFFIDTCHSGNVLGTRRGLLNDLNGVVNELTSAENGAVVFAASTGNQYSLEKIEWQNGAFTKAVVEGLLGGADYTGKSRITVNMLDLYISERVKQLTAGRQTPTTAKPQTVPDFPIALKR